MYNILLVKEALCCGVGCSEEYAEFLIAIYVRMFLLLWEDPLKHSC